MDELCTFDDFMKVDIRAGVITKAETVAKSDKLLKLEVFLGTEIGHRTIMAGIAKHYDVVGVVGQLIMVVVNLEPRPMMGVISEGMLLAGKTSEGHIMLALCPSVEPGTRLG